MLRPVLRPLVRSIAAALYGDSSGPMASWMYGLDGVNDYGIFTSRVMTPSADLDVRWTHKGYVAGAAQTVLSQSLSATATSRGFVITVTGANLAINLGGVTTTFSSVYGDGDWRLTYVGTAITLFKNGAQVGSTTAARGANQEATATAKVGARENGAGSFVEFCTGYLSNIYINGTTWPFTQYPYAIQKSDPDGLGAELITAGVQAAPATKGSQWTALGNGRWQYVGDGSLNQLIFIALASQPFAGFLEFEIESITGNLSCTSAGTITRGNFNAPGKYRYFYTDKNEGGTNGAAISFQRPAAGNITSCIIKNISFKPMGTYSALTLTGTWTVAFGTVAINAATQITLAASPDSGANRPLTGLVADVPVTVTYACSAETVGALLQWRTTYEIYYHTTIAATSGSYTFTPTATQIASGAVLQIEKVASNINFIIDSVTQNQLTSNPISLVNFSTSNWQQV